MKWYSPFFIILGSLAIVLLVGWGLYGNLDFRQPTSQAVKVIIPAPIHSSSSVSTFSVSPSPSAENIVSELGEEWKIYKDEKYKFEIRYSGKEWVLTHKIPAAALFYTPVQEPINLITMRILGHEGITVVMTIAIYEKPSTMSMEWLSKSYGTDLSKVTTGGIDTAFAEAYGGNGKGFLTYNESRKNNTMIYEVGSVSSDDYSFDYATFFVRENLPYVYEVSFHFPEYNHYNPNELPNNAYIDRYSHVISSFKFTE